MYVDSFVKLELGTLVGWLMAVLMLVAIGLIAPIFVIDAPARYRIPFAWKGFPGMPTWVSRCSSLLSLVMVGHFSWFLAHAMRESAADNQVVQITPAYERLFATVMTSFYFGSTTYWWFRRDPGRRRDV